jgi:hypothetical protein
VNHPAAAETKTLEVPTAGLAVKKGNFQAAIFGFGTSRQQLARGTREVTGGGYF